MNWRKIDNQKRVQNDGVYNDWKQQISDDCFNQCVYCSIHEQPWGGIDHYHIEHYKPKSKFVDLENKITNLYHACPICNRFKSDDWPCDADDLNKICYPDPGLIDYKELFYPLTKDYLLRGKNVASNYIINRLYLNRPQLIFERRESILKERGNELIDELSKLVNELNDITLFREFATITCDIHKHLIARDKIVPYRLSDIRK